MQAIYIGIFIFMVLKPVSATPLNLWTEKMEIGSIDCKNAITNLDLSLPLGSRGEERRGGWGKWEQDPPILCPRPRVDL